MKLKVNDKERECGSDRISELISELALPDKGIAVAVNNKMIPRTKWEDHQLFDGDNILIIKAVCGG